MTYSAPAFGMGNEINNQSTPQSQWCCMQATKLPQLNTRRIDLLITIFNGGGLTKTLDAGVHTCSNGT